MLEASRVQLSLVPSTTTTLMLSTAPPLVLLLFCSVIISTEVDETKRNGTKGIESSRVESKGGQQEALQPKTTTC